MFELKPSSQQTNKLLVVSVVVLGISNMLTAIFFQKSTVKYTATVTELTNTLAKLQENKNSQKVIGATDADFILKQQKKITAYYDSCIRKVYKLGTINDPDPLNREHFCVNDVKTSYEEYNLLVNLYGERALPDLVGRTVNLIEPTYSP